MKTRNLLLILFVFVFGIQVVLGNAAEFDWPRWRGPNGDGISLEKDWNPEALADGPKVLWREKIGAGYSNIVVQDDRLYTMGMYEREPTIYCLDAVTGKVIWRQFISSQYLEPRSTPTVDGNLVYGLGSDGTLLCLKTKNGRVRWKKNLKIDFNAQGTNGGWATSPIVEGSLLLINANTVQLALVKKTGDFMWGIDDEKPSGSWGSYASTVLYDYDGTRCALFLGPSTLNAVDVTTGKVLWSYMHDDKYHPVADPIAFDNKVFISLPEYCVMLEISGIGPSELWSNTEFNSWSSTAVTIDGYLFGMHSPHEYIMITSWGGMLRNDWPLRCIDAKTGTVMWEKEMKPFSLTGADGKLIILELNGTLRIADATSSSYRELSSVDVLEGEKKSRIFATPPVLCNGKIYCRNYAGDLICIDVSK